MIVLKKIEKMHYLFITSSLLFLLTISSACEKETDSEILVSDIDVTELVDRLFSTFDFTLDASNLAHYKELILTKNEDGTNILISMKIDIYENVNQCISKTEEYINSISIVMNDGPYNDIMIGNRLWWNTPENDSEIITNLIFIRNNIAFEFTAHNYGAGLIEAATKIDKDIIKKCSYITFED